MNSSNPFPADSDVKVTYYLPSLDLRQYIKYYWIVNVKSKSALSGPALISPSGFPELIFNFGATVHIDSLQTRKNNIPSLFVGGQITKPIAVAFGSSLQCLCVKLQPHSLKALFNTDSSLFTDKAISVSDINPRLNDALYHQLSEASSDDLRIDSIENHLRSLLKLNHHKVSATTTAVVEYIRKNPHMSLNILNNLVGCSSRTLQRQIKQDIGISPKMLYRILRFNKTYYQIKNNHQQSMHDIAFHCGYYDLSHLVNEFREFTGNSPALYFSDENVYNKLFAGIV